MDYYPTYTNLWAWAIFTHANDFVVLIPPELAVCQDHRRQTSVTMYLPEPVEDLIPIGSDDGRLIAFAVQHSISLTHLPSLGILYVPELRPVRVDHGRQVAFAAIRAIDEVAFDTIVRTDYAASECAVECFGFDHVKSNCFLSAR